MTKQQMTNLFSWLPEGCRPQPNSGHSMLFMIEQDVVAVEVCDELTQADVKYTCEQADDLCYEIEAQTED